MLGSGTPLTGVLKASEKLGSFALFASNPTQYCPAGRLRAEIVPEKPSPPFKISLPKELQLPPTPGQKIYDAPLGASVIEALAANTPPLQLNWNTRFFYLPASRSASGRPLVRLNRLFFYFMFSRRVFLNASAVSASTLATARLFSATKESKTPSADLEKLGGIALREAKKQRATYCDIRITRYRDQSLTLRLSPERGTGKTLEVPGVQENSNFGFGVRVIADGA